MNIIPIITEPKRQCGTCSVCCEGWLDGSAYGHAFYPGRQCHFHYDNTCSIYGHHPVNPCKNFNCLWVTDNDIPGWMKPDQSRALITKRTLNGIEYIEILEAGKKLDSSVLSWFFIKFATGEIKNLAYKIDNGWNLLGSNEFVIAKQNSVNQFPDSSAGRATDC